MDVRINEWIIDFMNMVFGAGDETETFWEEVLFPELYYHYYSNISQFDIRELHKFDRNLNALFFALCE